MSISEELDEIMSIQLVKTDGLPEKVISSLDELLKKYRSDDILASMKSLYQQYNEAELSARNSMGGSGMGAEFHMLAALKVGYLSQSVRYIERVTQQH